MVRRGIQNEFENYLEGMPDLYLFFHYNSVWFEKINDEFIFRREFDPISYNNEAESSRGVINTKLLPSECNGALYSENDATYTQVENTLQLEGSVLRTNQESVKGFSSAFIAIIQSSNQDSVVFQNDIVWYADCNKL